MKLFSGSQIKNWDQFTIQNEPVSSVDLMERAAAAFARQFENLFPDTRQYIHFFAGPGNNGGDALAIARILHFKGYAIRVSLCEICSTLSTDCTINLDRLPSLETIFLNRIKKGDPWPDITDESIVVDGIFGTGLNRPIKGYWADLIDQINQHTGPKIAVDIPSGLPAEGIAPGTAFQADHTISFERPKLSFFLAENQSFLGQLHTVPINLAEAFAKKESSSFFLNEADGLKPLIQKRDLFSHKGSFGHALLISGSFGMLGASQLCGQACLRSGAGLVSLYVPKIAYPILQGAVPEAMVIVDPNERAISQIPDLRPYTAVGIGPGLGQSSLTRAALWKLLKRIDKNIVVDADALNILAKEPERLKELPPHSILTPHPGEFKRLFGASKNSWEQLDLLREKSQDLQLIIILKGAYTRIALPDGRLYFNASGNPGMATGGSGDVLTGVLTGLLAQGYRPEEAARLGVFLHGSAGDLAAQESSQTALIAGDITQNLGKAFKKLER